MEINFVTDFQQDSNLIIDDKNHFIIFLLHISTLPPFIAVMTITLKNQSYRIVIDRAMMITFLKAMNMKMKSIQMISNWEKEIARNRRILIINTILMFENNKSINPGPLTRFVTYIHSLSTELTGAEKAILITKIVSNKNIVKNLQILIEKVSEFKNKAFRLKHNTIKLEENEKRRKKGLAMKIMTLNQ